MLSKLRKLANAVVDTVRDNRDFSRYVHNTVLRAVHDVVWKTREAIEEDVHRIMEQDRVNRALPEEDIWLIPRPSIRGIIQKLLSQGVIEAKRQSELGENEVCYTARSGADQASSDIRRQVVGELGGGPFFTEEDATAMTELIYYRRIT